VTKFWVSEKVDLGYCMAFSIQQIRTANILSSALNHHSLWEGAARDSFWSLCRPLFEQGSHKQQTLPPVCKANIIKLRACCFSFGLAAWLFQCYIGTPAWPIMCKYDVIHKTGSTQYIATPPEEDRATDIGNMQKN